MKILITGATGQVGGAVVQALVAAGIPVRTLVRESSKADALGNTEVARGSFEDDASLVRALSGIDALFLAGRDSPDTVALQRNVLQHAERSRVRYVVKLSAIGARENSPIELMRDHYAVDKSLKAGHLHWTLIKPHLYMQNLLRSADSIKQHGRLSAPMADKRMPLVDTRDIGIAAAVVFHNPELHVNKTYRLTGPAACSYTDVARALSDAAGRQISYESVSPADLQKKLVDAGTPGWRAFDLAHIASAYTDADCQVSPDFEALVGRLPISIETFSKDHKSVFARRDVD